MTTSADAISTPLLIAGEERPGGAGTFPVYDPAQTGAIIGYAAAASRDDALAAVAAAEAAWPAWAAMSATERVGIVLKALAGLESDNDARTDILSRENGKIRFEAFIDLAVFSGRFHQAAEYAPELDNDEHIAGPPFNTTITKLSRGVVTIIYPFNWPLAILAASLPAALMSGNTVIVKPPPTTPLSSVQTLQAPGAGAAAGRAQRGHRRGRRGRPGRRRRPADQARLLHRLGRRRQADHDDGRRERHQRDPRAWRQRPGPGAARRGARRGGVREDERRDVHDHRPGVHGAQAALRAALPLRRGHRRAAATLVNQKIGPGLDPDDHDGPAQHGQPAGLRRQAARGGEGGRAPRCRATASTPATGRRATTCCRRSSSTRQP